MASSNIGSLSAATIEAMAIREAIRFVTYHDIPDAIIESDAKMVTQALNKDPLMIALEFGAIVEEIISLVAGFSCNNLKFRYIPRQTGFFY